MEGKSHVIKGQTGIISICAAAQLIIMQAVVSECEKTDSGDCSC